VLVAPTNILSADLGDGAGDTTITVKYNNLAMNDVIYMEAAGKSEFMYVTSPPGGSAGAYTYTVTRHLEGGSGDLWYAGDAILNTRTVDKGFIDLYAAGGILYGTGPTITGNVRTATGTYNAISTRWAIGNLNGLYNYGTDVYGAAFGVPDETNVTIDAANGFRIRYGTTEVFKADTSGNLALTGSLTIGSAGVIKSGATAWDSGTGYWLSYNSGTPQFRIGNPTGNRFAWDGTNIGFISANLTINQNGVVVAMGSNSRDNTHAYAFSGTGADFLGVYGNSVWTSGAGAELLSVLDTGTGSAHNHVRIQAKTGSREAYIICDSSEPDSWSRLWLYSADGAYAFKPPGAASGTTWPAKWEVASADWWFLKYDSSDERLKQQITPLARGMATLREVVPIRFEWRSTGETDIGFSAQNCLPHIPESTRLMHDGFYSFKIDPIVAVAVAAIRELDARLSALETAHAHDHD
jgi:hypothetical protein